MPLTAGAKLGAYEITAAIGAGGMGEVYRARDTKLGREVAIKILPRAFTSDPERLARFEREARILASLNHPNIVTLHDIASEGGIAFLVMEYVPGTSLDRLIPPRGLPLPTVLGHALQIASALAAAHAAGIVHRDIKPANVIATPESSVKVLDFGLAKLAEVAAGPASITREAALTEPGAMVGTVAYMAPEQARGEGVDARADLFSFGALLYELATGRRAFAKSFDWTRPVPQRLDPTLQPIVFKLIEPDRDLRYQTVADVIADLKRLQRAAEGRHPSKRRWPIVAAASVVVAIAAAAIVWLWPRRPPGPDQWVQLTNFPDSVSQPALSPDGRMLTFIRGPGTFYSPGQIYAKMLPDGEPKPLTQDASRKMSPVFAPDGSRIAYTTVDDAQFKWDTWVVPVLGGEPRMWLPNASGLVWVEKQKLLFSEIKKNNHMAIVAAEESRTGAQDVYVPARENGMAHRSYPSPDGKWALIVEMDGAWLPCRLVPMDRTSLGRQVGPSNAVCTFAAWSPDGKWMYFSSSAGGNFHIWRQRFPDGQPQQITSGPTEEEGVAMAADGRSFVTAVGLRQRSVVLHDSSGERQISVEGYAFNPRITADGKRLCYLVLKGVSIATDPVEIWMTELDSGHGEPLLPGFSLAGGSSFDFSPDGRRLVVPARDREGKQGIWVVPLDRQSPPHQIIDLPGQPGTSANNVSWLPGEVFFYAKEGDSGFAYRVREDGTGLQKTVEQPISQIQGLSPDGQWLIAWTGATIAYPMGGGSPVRIFGEGVRFRWSPSRRFLFLSLSTTGAGGVTTGVGSTYVVPLPPGRMLPQIPAGGFRSVEQIATLPGVRVIESSDGTPGPTPEIYAFSRETTQRNLYRIPVP